MNILLTGATGFVGSALLSGFVADGAAVKALVRRRSDALPYAKLNQTLVRMREGGVSTSGFKSYWVSSKDQLRALRENGVYSNLLFVLIRLPIKFVQKFFRKGSV